MECVVEFEYEANEDDELTLKKGDIISNVSMYEDGWMKGTLRGKEGVFPDNFVKIIKTESKVPERNETKVDTIRKSQEDLIAASRRRGDNRRKNEKGQNSDVSFSVGQKVRAVHRYTPHQKDELALETGSIVEILELDRDEEDAGWLKGSCNGKVGVFPGNFVVPLSPSSSRRLQSGTVESGDNAHPSGPGKKVVGVGFGNIFTGEPIQLKTASVKEAKRESEESPAQAPRLVPRPNKPGRSGTMTNAERVIVKYPYTSENPDELTIEKGDIITIVDKNLEDDGWWKGELNGKIGVFPDNFVEAYPIGSKDDKSKQGRPAPPPLPSEKPNTTSDKSGGGKKPGPPPILAKKPNAKTPANGRPTVADNRGDGLFDNLPNHQPLQTLTSDRPRVANKRLPSKEFLRASGEEASIEKDEEKVPTRREPPPRPNSKPLAQMGRSEPPASSVALGNPPLLAKVSTSPVSASKPAPPPPPPPAAPSEPTVSPAEMAELKREFDHRLSQEIAELRTEMERMRSTLISKIHNLTAEVDEEKRIRHSAQVELERVRRLLQEQELNPPVPHGHSSTA